MIEIGDIVETEDGKHYPVVGREQGGRTRLLPTGTSTGEIDFATREFWLEDLELVEKDASTWDVYRRGMRRGLTPGEAKLVLDALDDNQPERAKHVLREKQGIDSPYDWINGHIIGPDGDCHANGCELLAPHTHTKRDIDDEELSRNWVETVAKRASCPASTESIEVRRPVYEECPNCDTDVEFQSHCPECGFPVGQ